MYINQIDELFENILNNLNDFLIKNKSFNKFRSDTNFVKFQNEILTTIKKFIDTSIKKEDILKIINNETYYDYILETIKRYCVFYIYIGIGYYYEGNRDLYITNIIELSKNQKDSTFQIANFYNSENNSKLINAFNDIKNILYVYQLGKTMDKIKIILANNPLKFDSTIKLFNELGEDYIIDNFLIKDNFHNILKTLIFKQIYIKEDKNEMFNFLNQEEKEKGEYKYIEILVSNEKKIIDFNQIQKFLIGNNYNLNFANEIYDYLSESKEINDLVIKENQDFVNFLFSKGVLIPISEDFLRYHNDSEKYDTETLIDENIKNRDATKIKYIINKMNNVRNYHSPLLEKNPKLKLDTEKLFHKSHDPRQTVLFNENEELKIIQKLRSSENTADIDLLIDLENIRKYAYINYKNFSQDGFKLRTTKTITSIRSINFKNMKNPIETRIGHDNLELSVIGVVWNPSNTPLECFISEQLTNVTKITKSDNGFKSFLKVINKTFDKKNDKLYYWLFNTKKDIVKSKGFVNINVNDTKNNIKIMISEIYNQYIEIIKNKYENYIKSLKEITLWNMDNLLKGYAKKYFDFNLNPEIRNELIEKTLEIGLRDIPIEEDDVDSMIPGKRDELIILPKIDRPINRKNIIIINEDKEENIELSSLKNEPICLHYIKWKNINKMSKTKSETFSQTIVDFAKQYVKLNNNGEYICKSCNEFLSLKKFIYEGTYVAELDTFMTTNIAVNQKLEEISKYSKYMRTIRNLEKNIEKIAYLADLNIYIGNTPTTRLRRKLIIKDVLDMILLHTEYLKKQPKDRIEQASKKYNINKDFTNLFFFELKDEIFLTSSNDTDYYKLIKYNNIVVYLLFIMLLDLNSGQLLNLKDDKRCNFFFYEKFGSSLFNDLYLRINQKEKTLITKIPLLCYSLFYFSCIFINNRVWLWNDKDADPKSKLSTNINIQKSIIHTTVDLINSIIEANFEKDKNYMYEFISTRFTQKIIHTFNDTALIKRIQDKITKKITYDETTKKINYVNNKVIYVDINEKIEFGNMNDCKDFCNVEIKEIEHLEHRVSKNNLDLLSNCVDGNFHSWEYNNGDMICKKCKQSYNNLVKQAQTSTQSHQDENKYYLQKLKIINLQKLAKKYCISGELHDVDKSVCTKCNKNPEDSRLTDKDLELMGRNIDEKTYEINIDSFKQMKQFLLNKEEESVKIKNIISKFNSNYEKDTGNKLYNYVSDFIDKLVKILGPKIKINNETLYLKDTLYIVNHDHLGNSIKDNIIILSSENKIEIVRNHPHYKRDIIYYKDKYNNVYVYYDFITLQYLGYSDNNREFKNTNKNASIEIMLSVRDCIMILGLENRFMNVYHLNSEYLKYTTEKILSESYYIINNYLRTRVNNIKQIILRIISIVNNISNNGKNTSFYNSEEKKIMDEFNKKIKYIELNDKNSSKFVFKHWNLISNNIDINKIPENMLLNISINYFDALQLNHLNNSDCKLIFYLIFNFNRMLDYNSQSNIQSELAYLIVRLIKFSFNQYYRPYSDIQVRKFDFILLNETPYIDENLKVSGFYQELLNNKEIEEQNEKEKDNNIDTVEAFESLDIDDYEIDDDIDGSMEALDNSGE